MIRSYRSPFPALFSTVCRPLPATIAIAQKKISEIGPTATQWEIDLIQ
jgi:hypothetical protein